MRYKMKTSLLEEFADVKGGKRLPKGANLQTIPNSHPYIRIRDLGSSKVLELNTNYEYVDDETQKTISRYIVSQGDILISIVGTIGLIGIVGHTLEKANLTENCVKLVNIRGIDREYLYYYLISKLGKDEITKGTVGAVQPKLPIKNIQKIAITHPLEIGIQKRIASILKTIDDKITLNRKINNNLFEQSSVLFQKLCVDEASSDWKEGVLGDIAYITSGKRPPMRSDNMTDEAKIPLVGAASIMGYTSEANHTDKILVTGRVGTHGVVQRFNHPCWTSDNTLVITSQHYEFVYQILRRIDYKAMNRGSTQPLITQGDLKKVAILIPDTETLQKFESLAGTLMNQYEDNIFENEKLAETRDALLPILMSGELDVSDIEL